MTEVRELTIRNLLEHKRRLALTGIAVLLGVAFIAHGYQKLAVFGLAGATEAFRGMGVPAPELTAPAISVI